MHLRWFDELLFPILTASPLWAQMEATVENSRWHREANVAVHTQMAINAARDAMAAENTMNEHDRAMVLLALAFHDVGKPTAEETKESVERGVYRSYASHEQHSARGFEDFYINNWDTFNGVFSIEELVGITWMIENHLPYSLKDKKKVNDLYTGIKSMPTGVFFHMLAGDQLGRVSDDAPTNIAAMRSWIAAAEEGIKALPIRTKTGPHAVMFVGAMGSGKTTAWKQLSFDPKSVFSYDDLYIQFARTKIVDFDSVSDSKSKYDIAFRVMMENDKEFTQYAQNIFMKMVERNQPMVIDMTNAGKKSRRRWISILDQHGYHTVSAYVPCSLRTLMRLNGTRTDKTIPQKHIITKWETTTVPFYGEFDSVMVLDHHAGL